MVMGKIKILDESISNIIAAGEVVENPTSLIKELLENSLDGGSTEIILSVKDGGRNIEITDNGIGMSKEDLLLCIERHATSKISKKEDLYSLNSYGFRGEALSSICAVSKVKITSKTKDSKIGNSMTVLAGKVTSIKETERNIGTTIEIKELFFNTPARLKFLRKPTTEYNNIKEIVISEALGNPNVAITLTIEGKEAIKTSGIGLDNTIVQIFNGNIFKNLRKFKYGFLGNSTIARASKDSLFVFVNKRIVKSLVVEKAILDGYYTQLVKGKYPFAIIFLDVPPGEIDVNVHPSKKIIKFSKELDIYNLLLNEIKELTLGNDILTEKNVEVTVVERINEETGELEKELISPKNNFLSTKDFIPIMENKVLDIQTKTNKDISLDLRGIGRKNEKTGIDLGREIANKIQIVQERIGEFSEKESLPAFKNINSNIKIEENKNKIMTSYKVIGQLLNSYILVEADKKLEIYDQHIVHERILYEELKKQFLNKNINKQGLLIPMRVEVDPRDKEIIFENISIFEEFGFSIDEFQDKEILIRNIPVFDFRENIESVFQKLVLELKNSNGLDLREKILISMSCKGAIKAGERLTLEEMEIMIEKLHNIGKYTCPHGRPIILKLTEDEIEKKFKRK
jgi:DNA mismatch repair protein MutL